MIFPVLMAIFSITCIYAGILTFPQDPVSAAALILVGVVLLLKPIAVIHGHFRKPPVIRQGVVDLQQYRAKGKGRKRPPREKTEKREKPPTYH